MKNICIDKKGKAHAESQCTDCRWVSNFFKKENAKIRRHWELINIIKRENGRRNYQLKCKQCERISNKEPSNLKSNGCKFCSNQVKTPEEIEEILEKKGLKLVGPYKGVAHKHKIFCLKCSKELKNTVTLRIYIDERYDCDCPCSKNMNNGKLETRLFSEISFFIKGTVSQDRTLIKSRKGNNREIDILLPKHKLAIEIDGKQSHKGKQRLDFEKNKLIQEQGYRIIRIRDNHLKSPINLKPFFLTDTGKSDPKTTFPILSYIFKTIYKSNIPLKIKKYLDKKEFVAKDAYVKNKKKDGTELIKVMPKIETIWCNEHNNNLPSKYTEKSNDQVCIFCPTCKEHETIRVSDLTKRKSNFKTCPFENSKGANKTKGCGSLLFATHPHAKEVNLRKSGIKKSDLRYISVNSSQKLFFTCVFCKSTNSSSPGNRINHNKGCKVCGGGHITLKKDSIPVMARHLKTGVQRQVDLNQIVIPKSEYEVIKRLKKLDS